MWSRSRPGVATRTFIPFLILKKNNNINKITKNEHNKKFTAGLHFFSKRLSLNSLSCTRQGKWGRKPDLFFATRAPYSCRVCDTVSRWFVNPNLELLKWRNSKFLWVHWFKMVSYTENWEIKAIWELLFRHPVSLLFVTICTDWNLSLKIRCVTIQLETSMPFYLRHCSTRFVWTTLLCGSTALHFPK